MSISFKKYFICSRWNGEVIFFLPFGKQTLKNISSNLYFATDQRGIKFAEISKTNPLIKQWVLKEKYY